MHNKYNVLIISYYFTPDSSIGARRWSKFEKYIRKSKYPTYILTVKKNKKKSENSNYYYVKNYFPPVLEKNKLTLFDKFKYSFWYRLMLILSKGSPYDETIFIEKRIIKTARKIINKHQITTIIANGAPFRILYYATKLKQEYPHITLISDLRDPWTLGKAYGMNNIGSRKIEFENMMEANVFSISDYITVPVIEMKSNYSKKYPQSAYKIIVLPHGFDPCELPIQIKTSSQTTRKPTKIIYAGTIYDECNDYFSMIQDSLKCFSDEDFMIDFYSHSTHYSHFTKAYSGQGFGKFLLPVSPNELFEKIIDYDYYLAVYPEKYKNHFSTKFSEIIALRIPIIFVGEEGDISNFLIQNNLGIHIAPKEIHNLLPKIINNNISFTYNNNFNIEQFSLEKITNDLIKLFK